MPGDDDHGPRPRYPIESVDNALKILLLFGERRSVRLTEVSDYLSVASSTAHRLLAMLQYRGFVRQGEATRAYEPGPALTSIAFSVLRQSDVRGRLHPYLERLSTSLGETVHLARLSGTKVVFVDAVESARTVRVGSRVGMSLPAHCTSSGKVLLATLGPSVLAGLYPDARLDRVTARSIVSRAELFKVVDEIRRAGFATNNEESEDGVASVAVALGEYDGGRYSLNVSMPVTRMNDDVRLEIADELRQVCREVSSFFA